MMILVRKDLSMSMSNVHAKMVFAVKRERERGAR